MSGRGNTIEPYVPVGHYTRGMLAAQVGVSKDTVKRWAVLGVLMPHLSMSWGSLTVPLYDVKDLALARKLASRTDKSVAKRKEAA